MGNRLHVEVLDRDGRPACAECVRDLVWDLEETPSMGIAPTDSLVRVRARLFRTDSLRSSDSRNVDVVARLPAVSDSGDITNVSFPVPMECFGRPPDVEHGTSCRYDAALGFAEGPEPILGASADLPPLADDPSCAKSPPDGMQCVGSGTFLLGDERVDALAFDYPARPESIQRVPAGAALMFDTNEMTVGSVRKLVREGRIHPGEGSSRLLARGAARTVEEQCTYLGPDDARNDALPITCIGRDLARSVCAAFARRLPLEYEWELAAGNGAREHLYPWLDSTPSLLEVYDLAAGVDGELVGICKTAIVARGRARFGESTTCGDDELIGPVAGGSAEDITSAGIKNLGGNVAEWVDDELALYDEECWSRPLGGACRIPSKRLVGSRAAYRGGSWASPPHATLTVARFGQLDGAPSPAIGFRCAITEDQLP